MTTNTTKTAVVDVTVENHGTLFAFNLLTDAAREWVAQYVDIEDYMWAGDRRFNCEHRCARHLVEGMLAEGLVVE